MFHGRVVPSFRTGSNRLAQTFFMQNSCHVMAIVPGKHIDRNVQENCSVRMLCTGLSCLGLLERRRCRGKHVLPSTRSTCSLLLWYYFNFPRYYSLLCPRGALLLVLPPR